MSSSQVWYTWMCHVSDSKGKKTWTRGGGAERRYKIQVRRFYDDKTEYNRGNQMKNEDEVDITKYKTDLGHYSIPSEVWTTLNESSKNKIKQFNVNHSFHQKRVLMGTHVVNYLSVKTQILCMCNQWKLNSTHSKHFKILASRNCQNVLKLTMQQLNKLEQIGQLCVEIIVLIPSLLNPIHPDRTKPNVELGIWQHGMTMHARF